MAPLPLLWLTRRAASASERSGLAWVPELVSRPLAGSRWIVLPSAGAFAPASCAAARAARSTDATAAALSVVPIACLLFMLMSPRSFHDLDDRGERLPRAGGHGQPSDAELAWKLRRREG